MNNRLDYINNFEDGAIEKMTEMRAKFIALDEELRMMLYIGVNTITPNEALKRSIALARTNLEQALQYSIKSLCLKHEKREDDDKTE